MFSTMPFLSSVWKVKGVSAREAREAWSRRPPQDPRELLTELVRAGFLNAQGQVTRLIGGSAEPEPNYETWTMADTPRPEDAGA